MAANDILPYLIIALQAEPELLALIQSVRNLLKKYPALTADQIMTLVEQVVGPADQEFDAVLQKIAADQGKAPG